MKKAVNYKLARLGQGGFTMIELIMTMAIIGSLATIFIMRYPGVQKTARDTQRRNDLSQYRITLERYSLAHSNIYPVETSANARISTTTYCNTILGIVGACSIDPKDTQTVCSSQACGYFYRSNATGTSYVLWAPLEKPATTGRLYFTFCSNGNVGETANLTTDGTCPTIP